MNPIALWEEFLISLSTKPKRTAPTDTDKISVQSRPKIMKSLNPKKNRGIVDIEAVTGIKLLKIIDFWLSSDQSTIVVIVQPKDVSKGGTEGYSSQEIVMVYLKYDITHKEATFERMIRSDLVGDGSGLQPIVEKHYYVRHYREGVLFYRVNIQKNSLEEIHKYSSRRVSQQVFSCIVFGGGTRIYMETNEKDRARILIIKMTDNGPVVDYETKFYFTKRRYITSI